ncbi:MAG: inositol monophosphatase [Alphaproteobacteria bacterium]|nr:inositol monophosphatase [Alphaproteobacteria bacterium]
MIDVDVKKIDDIIRHVAKTEVLPRHKNLKEGDFREKNPDDFVTIADEESERVLTELLAEALPGSIVVGEEAVAKNPAVLEHLSGDAPVWVVDPIDGTYNFLHGRRYFGILVALVHKGETLYGWGYDVPGDRMAFARRGGGAFLDGTPLQVTCSAANMGELRGVAGGAQPWHFKGVSKHVDSVINLRCSLHDFLHFLTGEVDFILHVGVSKPWDHAAGCLIVEEAGGYVAVKDGDPYSPLLHERAFILTAPSREWWEEMAPMMRQAMR